MNRAGYLREKFLIRNQLFGLNRDHCAYRRFSVAAFIKLLAG